MKILLTTIGSSGDINPFVALAKGLERAGHETVLAVNPYFQPSVERAGVRSAALGEMISPVEFARENPAAFGRFLGPIVLFRKMFIPFAAESYETLKALAIEHEPDVMVGHQISFGLPWAADELGIPWATCALAPATVLSAHDPSQMPIGTDLTKMPMWYRRFAKWAVRSTISLFFDGGFNRMRRQCGVRTRRDTLFGEMLGGSAVLGMWSPSWRGPAADDPARLTICGFPWFDRRTDGSGSGGDGLDGALLRFLDEGEAPVVFALGSVLSHMSAEVYAEAARACEMLGVRGVFVTGGDETTPMDLPERVLCVDYAPYGALFPRGSAVVHHGGVGTTAQGLRAGVPTVILPHAHDQFDNAARCARRGVSRTLRRRRARDLAGGLEAVLGDREMRERASALGESIRGEDGVGRAVTVIEGIMDGRAR